MEMVGASEGRVKFDDEINVGKIETTGCDVSGDEDRGFGVLGEVSERGCSEGLLKGTVESVGGYCMGFGGGIVTGTGPSDPDIVRSATNGVHHNAGFDLNMERQYAEGPYMNAPVEARVSY